LRDPGVGWITMLRKRASNKRDRPNRYSKENIRKNIMSPLPIVSQQRGCSASDQPLPRIESNRAGFWIWDAGGEGIFFFWLFPLSPHKESSANLRTIRRGRNSGLTCSEDALDISDYIFSLHLVLPFLGVVFFTPPPISFDPNTSSEHLSLGKSRGFPLLSFSTGMDSAR